MGSSRKIIAEAINSIPEKKEKLRKALEYLQTYSSLPNFTLEWKDFEGHFSAIEKSIDERFKALQENGVEEEDGGAPTAATPDADDAADAAAPAPRPELRSLCANMDAKGLRSYINCNKKDLVAIKEELAPAIRCAPDPALLILEAIKGFYSPNDSNTGSRSYNNGDRMTCINLLYRLHLISPEIKPSVKDKAKKLALEWKAKIPKTGNFGLEANAFLQLIASYCLIPEFPLDQVMELFISISWKDHAVDLLKRLRLDDKLPDLIEKLNSKGRQLDAVKFVYALNAVDKFPPIPLLKAYITESKKVAHGVQKKGNNSMQAQNKATAKEIYALKSVLKAVEEYKLESEYPRESLVKRIAQLEQKKLDKKRTATIAAASNSKPQQQQSNKRLWSSSSTSAPVIAANPYPPPIQANSVPKAVEEYKLVSEYPRESLVKRIAQLEQKKPDKKRTATIAAASNSKPQQQQSNKRPWSSPSTSAPVIAANPYPPPIQTQPQLGLADHAPYMSFAGPYGLDATGSLYHLSDPSLSGTAMGHGGTLSPPRSYYSSESLVGTISMYDRPVTYNGYPLSGRPSSYGSSLYP